jgi:hypothetical protein
MYRVGLGLFEGQLQVWLTVRLGVHMAAPFGVTSLWSDFYKGYVKQEWLGKLQLIWSGLPVLELVLAPQNLQGSVLFILVCFPDRHHFPFRPMIEGSATQRYTATHTEL